MLPSLLLLECLTENWWKGSREKERVVFREKQKKGWCVVCLRGIFGILGIIFERVVCLEIMGGVFSNTQESVMKTLKECWPKKSKKKMKKDK